MRNVKESQHQSRSSCSCFTVIDETFQSAIVSVIETKTRFVDSINEFSLMVYIPLKQVYNHCCFLLCKLNKQL